MGMAYFNISLKKSLTIFEGLSYFENTQEIQNRWAVKEFFFRHIYSLYYVLAVT